ncbi:unnamed protein product [Alternaria alternata]
MRLLQQQANGDADFSLVEFIDDIPPYAILSHTWGADHEEVTFKDIYKGKGKGRAKPGYEKLRKLIFFAANREKLGRLEDFADSIAVHCKIPLELFDAHPRKFRNYSIEERLKWTAYRQTKREEDAAYCLLGCFDVQMPLIYGEGDAKLSFDRERNTTVLGMRDTEDLFLTKSQRN